MESSLSAYIAALACLVLLVLGWVIALANGRQPAHLKFKGLGLEIQINPCGGKCKGDDQKEDQ